MERSNYVLPQEMLAKHAALTPDKVYLRQPVDRVVKEFTWKEVHDSALRMAAAFQRLGLRRGDKISILSKNVAEWFITDFAIGLAGMISAPIYPTAGEKTIAYVLEHSEAKVIVVGKLDDKAPAKAALSDRSIISVAMPYDTVDCDYQMEHLIASCSPLDNLAPPKLDDTFSLTYTSGSTGNPKGAVLSYRNIAYGALSMSKQASVTSEDRLLSYLPLAHIAERAIIEHASLYSGSSVTFVESLATFADDIQRTQPTFFLSVPRLWMKFQSGILSNIPQKKLDLLLAIPIVSGLIKNKIKRQLGLGKTRVFGSGTAPISLATLEWFRAIGIEISEGWGMTETAGTAVMNHPFRKEKMGTIGRPVDGTEIKISDNGEILVKGDGVIKAYYKEPEKTTETFKNGWLYTGDKGEFDAEGYLRITGRVKDIFKSGKGKYVVPVPIESLLFENTIIEQVCVMGSGLPQPVAAVVLTEGTSSGLTVAQVQESLDDTLILVNERLEGHEKLDRIIVAKEQWTIENGLLTPTLKIKRSELEDKYKDAISIETNDKVVWQ
mgnify:CR=1 FL=1